MWNDPYRAIERELNREYAMLRSGDFDGLDAVGHKIETLLEKVDTSNEDKMRKIRDLSHLNATLLLAAVEGCRSAVETLKVAAMAPELGGVTYTRNGRKARIPRNESSMTKTA